MAGEFAYHGRDVFPDIRDYLQSFLADDTYGTATLKDCLWKVDELIDNVPSALYDARLREELLGGRLPDGVRILLDGVGLLPDKEIERRWDMLKGMYNDFIRIESAPHEPSPSGSAFALVGDPGPY